LEWIDLKYLLDSNPIEVADYALANRIRDEAAFKWWVSDTLPQRNQIIGKVKSQYRKTTHKSGVQLPHLVHEALGINCKPRQTYGGRQYRKK
jgi:hypothetical protein